MPARGTRARTTALPRSEKRSAGSRLVVGLAGATMTIGILLSATPAAASPTAAPASAALPEYLGYRLTPSQSSGAGHYEWLGSYKVSGKQVWCVDYLYKAPGSDQRYQPGDLLKTKWDTAIPADQAADISYLLLRYGNTTSNDEAAALAHLLHTWTSPITDVTGTRHPVRGAKATLAYDPDFHLGIMPSAARQTAEKMRADASMNHGPWSAKATAPGGDQIIGQPATWTVRVSNAAGKGMPHVSVTFTATDGTLAPAEPTALRSGTGTTTETAADSAKVEQAKQVLAADKTTAATDPASIKVETDSDGIAAVRLTPTGASPKLSASFTSPNASPRVQIPVNAPDVQKVVLTGGEQTTTTTATASAHLPPTTVTPTVPVKIPAGGSAPNAQAMAEVHTHLQPAALIGLGALLLAGAGTGSLLVSRRIARRR